MAICIWRGDAPAIAQQTRVTAANVEIGDQFQLAINGKSVSFVAAATTPASVATGLAAVWNVSPIPEFAEITASVSGNDLILTADRPGVPFTVSPSTVNGGATDDQTLTADTVIAAAGPNDWNVARNWSGNAVPADGDDVYLVDSEVDVLYGLDQSTVAIGSLHIEQSFTGRIGLPGRNVADYAEYRPQFLQLAAVEINVGRGVGAGSSRIKLDTGTTDTTLNVFNTGSPDEGPAAVHWRGNSSAVQVHVAGGSVGIALQPSDAALLGELRIAPDRGSAADATVLLGGGVTVSGTIENSGGTLRCAGQSIATLVQHDGATTIESGSVDSLRVRGGTVVYNSTGTLSAAAVSGAGKLDFSCDLRDKTVAAPIEVFGSAARVSDPYQVVADLTLDLNETNLPGLDIGTNIRVTRGVPA